MTLKQRNYFFGALWPKACRVQGWTGALACEVKRREMVLQATTKLHAEVPKMRRPTDSMSECDRDQLTAVFNYTKWLGDPENLAKTMDIANLVEAKQSDDGRQVIWKINELGFTSGYIQRLAAYDCRVAQVSNWTDLPVAALKRVLIHATQRQHDKARSVERREHDVVDYQMRPSPPTKPKLCVAGPF